MAENRPFLTIGEIARRWHKNPTSVRRAIDSRHKPLTGYKSPDDERGVWLIWAKSVIDRWGMPLS